jgi:hypothetical protein
MRFTPVLLLTLLTLATLTTSCTTLANRRDLYFPEKVNGPYTRMKTTGIPKTSGVHGTVQGSSSEGKNVIKPAR